MWGERAIRKRVFPDRNYNGYRNKSRVEDADMKDKQGVRLLSQSLLTIIRENSLLLTPCVFKVRQERTHHLRIQCSAIERE